MRGMASCQPGFARGPLDGESDRGHCTHVQMKKWSFWGHRGQYMSWGESCLLGYHFFHYAFISVTVMGLWGCHACNGASPMAPDSKEFTWNAGDSDSIPGLEISPWRRAWQPTPVFLPGESHRQRSLVGYSPWGCKESDMTNTHMPVT